MFRQLQQDERGAISVEMAFIIPVLLIWALGSFEVSSMVARPERSDTRKRVPLPTSAGSTCS